MKLPLFFYIAHSIFFLVIGILAAAFTYSGVWTIQTPYHLWLTVTLLVLSFGGSLLMALIALLESKTQLRVFEELVLEPIDFTARHN